MGVSQGDACRAWAIYEQVLWAFEAEGRLMALRVRNRVYYSHDQLVSLLGPPKHPLTPDPIPSGGADKAT